MSYACTCIIIICSLLFQQDLRFEISNSQQENSQTQDFDAKKRRKTSISVQPMAVWKKWNLITFVIKLKIVPYTLTKISRW